MRSSNKSRSRNKNSRNRNSNNVGNIVNRVFDSSGPDGRVRGTPSQIIEKYETLARDAQLSGDRVQAENFLQHAEHYIRLLASAQAEVAREQAKRQAEHEARMASRMDESDEKNSSKNSDNKVTDSEPADTQGKPKKPKKPKNDEKSHEPSDAKDGFDEENAPDFLKIIND